MSRERKRLVVTLVKGSRNLHSIMVQMTDALSPWWKLSLQVLHSGQAASTVQSHYLLRPASLSSAIKFAVMSSQLVLERSRLDGMVVGGVTHGVYFLLTMQSLYALTRKARNGGKIAEHRLALANYIIITFILGTICFAANAKYTEMIWIDLRNVSGGPVALIDDEMKYRINVLAICSCHIQEWFMQALLLHRCFVIYGWAKSVVIPMVTLYIAMIALSIQVQVEASTGTPFYDIPTELAYLCIQVGLTVLYTILVTHRLLFMRKTMKQTLPRCDPSTYDTILMMVVESSVPFSIFDIIFIVAFALHYNALSTICFLSAGPLQGIAQLFIILRVATGRAVTHQWSTPASGAPTMIKFSGNESDTTEVSHCGQTSVHKCPTSEGASESDKCAA